MCTQRFHYCESAVTIEFDAQEYHSDGHFAPARYRFEGSTGDGYRVVRDGADWLDLGPGYTPVQTELCGVCSTDLDRHFLPFPLPQVTGHELVGRDETGRRVVVEINATLEARGLAAGCLDCRDGLARHCPKRLVLGIHDLPGGFGAHLLAPVGALVEVPDELPTDTAVLIEPFAAALRAVERIDERVGLATCASVAVLGPRKLGMLVLAALAGERRRRGLEFRITALMRRADLADLATTVGADETIVFVGDGADLPSESFDVVVDTTASAKAFELALRLARREVHLKSTNGQSAGGLEEATALVVDELSLEAFDSDGMPSDMQAAWIGSSEPPSDWAERSVRCPNAVTARTVFLARPGSCLAGAHSAVVEGLKGADAAIRPGPGDDQRPGVRPTGTILVQDVGEPAPLAVALRRGVGLSGSRCGDFRVAIQRLAEDPELSRLGERMITHRLSIEELPRAFEIARSRDSVKVVVGH